MTQLSRDYNLYNLCVCFFFLNETFPNKTLEAKEKKDLNIAFHTFHSIWEMVQGTHNGE